MSKVRTLAVFVSSPGDCGPERNTVSRITERLNQEPEVRAARVRFEALLFENIPGGPPIKGSAQARVREAMRRFGRSEYEVYLGFMKDIVGTATPKGPSGTIEEFDDAIRRWRRGFTTDVLFFFVGATALGDSADPNSVPLFRRRLESEKFVYTPCANEHEFHERVERQLRDIALCWNTPARRRRRALARLRTFVPLVGLILATLTLGFLLGIDRPASQNVLAATRGSEPRAIVEAWNKWGGRTFFFRSLTRNAACEALERSLASDLPVESRLSGWAAWMNSDLRGDGALERATGQLSLATAKTIDLLATKEPYEMAAALAARASDLGLWRDDPESERRVLRSVAERVLLDLWIALESTSDGQLVPRPTPLDRAAMRERGAVESRAALVAVDLLNRNAMPRVALAVAVAAGSDDLMERLANDAWHEKPGSDMSAIVAFVRIGSLPRVAAWVEEHGVADAKTYLVAQVVAGVQARGSLDLALLLTAMFIGDFSGKSLPIDPFAFAIEEGKFLGVNASDDTLQESLGRQLLIFIANDEIWNLRVDGVWPWRWLLQAMLPVIDRVDDDAERADVIARLLDEIGDDRALEDAQTEVIDFLGRSRDHTAIEGLLKQARGYTAGEVTFGYAQRAALIRALGRLDAPNFREVALQLARDARDEQASGTRMGNKWEDVQPQIEYLRSLRQAETLSESTAELIEILIGARVEDCGPWYQFRLLPSIPDPRLVELDHELGRWLRGLQPADLLRVLRVPAERSTITDIDGTWDRWLYILSCMEVVKEEWPPALTRVLASNLPFEEKLSIRALEWLALRGGDQGRSFLKETITVRPRSWLRYVALSGDVETLLWAAAHFEFKSSTEVSELADWITSLSPKDTERALRWAFDHVGDSPVLIAAFLPIATKINWSDPRLDEAGRLLLRDPFVQEHENFGVALEYFDAVAPDTVPALFESESLMNSLQNTTEFGFIIAMQAVDWSRLKRIPPRVYELSRQRRVAFVLRDADRHQESVASGSVMQVGDRLVESPLLAALGARPDDEGVEFLLELSHETAQPVEGLREFPDDRAVFRAYALWQAARAIEFGATPTSDAGRSEPWLALMGSSSAALRRAAATAVLALTQHCSTQD